MNKNILSDNGAKPIWIGNNKANHYVDFKTEFELKTVDSKAKIYISVDTEYALFINGVFVDMGAYDDFPDKKSYDVLEVAEYLKIGKNELLVIGYSQGIGSFQYIAATPFVMFSLQSGETIVNSDENVLCRENPNYTSGDIELISFQLGYSFEYDANKENNCWKKPVIVDSNKVSEEFFQRPIKKCIFEPKCDCIIKAQGTLLRKAPPSATPSECYKTDYLSTILPDEFYDSCVINGVQTVSDRQKNIKLYTMDGENKSSATFSKKENTDGCYVVLDMKEMQTGLLTLELEASNGTQIEIAYGECIDDLRVRSYVVKTVGKYICKDGYQQFTHRLKRLGGRYIQLHFTKMTGSVKLIYCGFIPMLYPVTVRPIKTGDRLFDKIYDVAVRTLRMCMHEHYEDCPLREQGLYGFDGLNQMLCGYYAFGETDMPRESIRLLAQGLNDKGLIPLCAPSSWEESIPMFSVAWVLALEKYFDTTKDKKFVEEMTPTFKKIIATYMSWLHDGIIHTPFGGQAMWNFYDWDYGLDDEERLSGINDGKIRLDAPLNFAFCIMMRSAEKLFSILGEDVSQYTNLRTTVSKKSHEIFYNEEKGLYVTYIGGNFENHYCELSQALAVLSGVNTDNDLLDKLADKDNGLIKTNLSLMYYKYEALLSNPDRYLPFVLDEIAEIWGDMLYNNATTFWETTRGEDDFFKTASLCHGWSAIPVYVFGKFLNNNFDI